MESDKAVSTLNTLIETCKDGKEGFRTAAEAVKNPQVKTMFAREREEFATELQQQVRALGGEPEQSSSMAGAMHRGWMNIKSAVTGKDEKAVIAEAERGEDVAVKQYQNALSEGLPSTVRPVVEQQFSRVKAAHDRVRDLERQYER
jgi:uncharacterized protein (TIGR02284 family)